MKFLDFFSKNSWWSILGGILPACAAVICLPLLALLHGAEVFSYVSLLCSVFLFLIVYDFGLSRSLHHFIPSLESEKDISEYLKSSMLIGVLLGLVAMATVYILSEPFIRGWLKPSEKILGELITSFKIIALGLIPSILISVYRGALEGKGEFRIANLAKMVSGCSLFFFPLLVYPISPSVLAVAFALVASRFFSFYIYFLLSERYLPTIFGFGVISRIKNIINYSLYAAVAGFISSGFIFLDRFFVAGYISTSELSVYILSQDIMSRYLLLPWSLAIVLVPLMAKSDKTEEQSQACTSWYKKVSLLNLFYLLVLLLFTFFIAPVFTIDAIDKSAIIIVLVLAIGVMAAAYSQLPLVSLFAKGKVKLLMFVFLFESFVYVLIAPYVFDVYGVVGASFTWSIRLVFEALLLRSMLNRYIRNK
ncbi:oligosaccharide flippase family protein [Methylophaga thalassica]|uniref:oligosaccharide flippase family protein n=1 Tax=Methylophaga aminisulfidivorans TaxID=230105 RepID=UPI003A8D9A2E